ncbi:MAG: hypothetical protein ACXACT_18155 [Candidatus Thorarchaeota archaeon]|jgi:hypothetical protein
MIQHKQGSDVLGYDTAQSMDHGWGPQLQIFLKDADYGSLKEEIDEVLRQNLPYEIRGFPTNFGNHDDGTTRMEMIISGPVIMESRSIRSVDSSLSILGSILQRICASLIGWFSHSRCF